MKKFAISDIHGCVETFKGLLNLIDLSPSDELYLLGDYIDRGPDSKGVIDHIWKLQHDGFQVSCLLGNHEIMLLNEIKSESPFYAGNHEVLQSFNIDHIKDIPVTYQKWMSELPYYFEVDEYILVHAGLNFKKADPLEDFTSMLWIRDWYEHIDLDWLGDRIIIHGHTPVPIQRIKSGSTSLEELPALDIDNGCALEKENFNNLCAFDLTTGKLFFHPNIDGPFI